MLKIICPSNNIPERSYAIKVLFNELLGCGLSTDDIFFDNLVQHYEIQYGDKKVVVEDHFFQHYPNPLTYLNKDHIPTSLSYFHAKEMEIPIIYGVDKYVEDVDGITIGLDIFASTFFMLTRWEESLLGREEKGDCDETQLFTVKMNIYQRPIVHEYEELLRKVLSDVGIQFKERTFSVVLSHDVDEFLTPSCSKIAKDFVKQGIYGRPKNRNRNLTWIEEIKYKKTYPSDYSQFEFYTCLSKQYKIPEWFYFKVCAQGEEESTYLHDSKQTIDIIDKLKELQNPNLVMGFHPSQSTFNNDGQWKTESDRINKLLGFSPCIGRNHHLLYNYNTLRNWEELARQTPEGIMDISNCVFHKRLGFRSGLAVSYSVFDVPQRRTMCLREHPCQIMDSAIRLHKYPTTGEMYEDIEKIIKSVQKHKGELLLTWHIYVRKCKLIKNYFELCRYVIEKTITNK